MPTTRTKWIKKKAHAFTWAAIWCLIFALPACFGLFSDSSDTLMIAAAIILVEIGLVSAAVFFWIREEKQEVNWDTD